MNVTPRQVQVWRMRNGGLSTTQIARELGIARHTVRNHLLAMARFVEVVDTVRQERGPARCVRLVVEEVIG